MWKDQPEADRMLLSTLLKEWQPSHHDSLKIWHYPQQITTWDEFLTLVTNHYNFKEAAWVLLRHRTSGGTFSKGLTTPRQTFQKGFTTQFRTMLAPVMKQQTSQIKQKQMQTRRWNIKCYIGGKRGHITQFCWSRPQVVWGMVKQENLALAEETHIDNVNNEDFTNAQQRMWFTLA